MPKYLLNSKDQEVSRIKKMMLECPVCDVPMLPPTKIFKAACGHVICGNCSVKLQPFFVYCPSPKCMVKLTDENLFRDFVAELVAENTVQSNKEKEIALVPSPLLRTSSFDSGLRPFLPYGQLSFGSDDEELEPDTDDTVEIEIEDGDVLDLPDTLQAMLDADDFSSDRSDTDSANSEDIADIGSLFD